MGLRIKGVLERLGVGPSELGRRFGRSRSTWSRVLAGEREANGARAEVEALLEERGLPVSADLWTQVRDDDPPREVSMQGQYLSEHARSHFRLFRSPFEQEAIIGTGADGRQKVNDLYMAPGHRFVEERLRQALLTAGFIAIAGEPGSGKSTLLDSALRRAGDAADVVRVTPANIERRKLTAAHISAEIIRQLSEEQVPRMSNVRDSLAAATLAHRYSEGQRVALVIDEAHELPHNTIKDLKRFHELRHGYAQLLAVILVGQTELRARFDSERNYVLREAIIRCQMVTLGPMVGHVPNYVAKRFEWVAADVNESWEPDALNMLERRLAVHEQQYPVLIGNAAVAAMNVAARRGNKRVSEEDVEGVWAASPEQLQELGL